MHPSIEEKSARLFAARVAELLRDRTIVTQEFYNPEEAAAFLGMSIRTLENYRVRHSDGPPFTRIGRLVRYKVSDLLDFMEARRIIPGVTDDLRRVDIRKHAERGCPS